MDDITRATIRYRNILQAENVLNNIQHLGEVPPWDTFGRSLTGGLAVLVGAGPSLDDSLQLLGELQERATIATVNTAAPTLAKAGIRIDLLVALENLDVTPHIAGVPRAHSVASLAAAPQVFRQSSAWCADPRPDWLGIIRAAQTEPVFAGFSALCMGYSMLEALGADTIALVGADLSIPQSGRMYAKGSTWEGLSVEVQGDGSVQTEGDAERQKLHWDANVPAPPTVRKATERVPAIGGGEVTTLPEFLTQLGWLERRAKRGHPRLVNLTRRGALIRGADETTGRRGSFPRARLVKRHGADPGLPDRVRAHLREEATAALAHAERMLARKSGPIAKPAPFVHGLVVPDVVGLQMDHPEMTMAAKFQALYSIWKRAAEIVLEAVGG